MDHPNNTRHTLLERACDPANHRAWEELVFLYRRFIFYILGEVGVPQRDLEDVTQQILLTLTRDLPKYDPSKAKFRTWFGTIIRHAAFAHHRKQRRNAVQIEKLGQVYSMEEASGTPSDLDQFIEDEWATYVSNLAMDRVRSVFRGQAIRVFELTLDGLSAAEIAQETGLSVSSVYTLSKRVKKRLYLEIRAITSELEQ